MKLPQTLDLLGKAWVITQKKDNKNYGTCQHGKCIINVNPSQPPQQMRDTVLHEVIHALEHEVQLKMSERQVTLLATVLLAAMRQNPKLSAFLLS
jgi:acetaldehyde dehydrogenase (acetylating)